MRPEQISLRVDHPPLSVNLLYTEMACSLVARAVCPSTEFRKALWTRISSKILLLCHTCLFKILIRCHLAWPISVLELTVLVNERIELFLGKLHCFRKELLALNKLKI